MAATLLLTAPVSAAEFVDADDVNQDISPFDGVNLNGVLSDEGFAKTDQIGAGSDETFQVPGAPGTMTPLRFTWEQDNGDFLATLGFYVVDDIEASITDPQAYMTEAISEGTVLFTEHGSTPDGEGDALDVNVPAGASIAFFAIPNDSASNFNASPSDYFTEDEVGYDNTLLELSGAAPESNTPAPTFLATHQPMSTEPDANFDAMDQFLAFGDVADDDGMLLILEDVSRADDFASQPLVAGGSFFGQNIPTEIDFDDAALRAQVVPEPAALSLLMLGAAGAFGRRRRRRASCVGPVV